MSLPGTPTLGSAPRPRTDTDPMPSFSIRPGVASGLAPEGAPGRLACVHCGEPVDTPGRWSVRLNGVDRPTCCAGCQAIAQAIHGAGLDEYYRVRSAPAAGAAGLEQTEPLELFDSPEMQARFVTVGENGCEAALMVEGLRCGACTWLLEQGLGRQSGVDGINVNLATERAHVRWNPAQTRLSTILAQATRLGYRLRPFDAATRERGLQSEARASLRRLFIAGLGMMQVMMYAVPVYLADAGEIEAPFEQLMRWASLVLTLPVVLYSSQPFFRGAFNELRGRRLSMDTPVALGIAAAFAASVTATVTGRGEVWFDTVAMFVFLLLGARHLEASARRRAARAIDALTAQRNESVNRIDPVTGLTQWVPAARLQPGEQFIVGAGEAVAVDAALERERGTFDLSLLTGEAAPVAHEPGARVPGGAINTGHPATLRALAKQADSMLSSIARLAERAATEKPPLAGITERIARYFVGALLLLAALVLLAWLAIDSQRAWSTAITVLVVSCPCALSLATPTALAAAQAYALSRGLIVSRGHALESLSTVSDVVFDKTGTLTRGTPSVVSIEALTGADTPQTRVDMLSLAAALETGSSHPLARAIHAAAQAARARPRQAQELRNRPGLGVEGEIDGASYRLGRYAFASHGEAPQSAQAGGPTESNDDDSASVVWLSRNGTALARLRIQDSLRDEAPAVVQALAAAGLRVHLLSGDHSTTVAAVARSLAIGDFRAQATPADKLVYVQALQRQGRRVAMVGDGVNDAPVLAAADVSIAVGQASALARTSADIVALGERLSDIQALISLARRTRAVMLQNLSWALLYNLIAIPAAALGWVSPWLAAIGMSLSSLFVAGNALRLAPAPAPRERAPGLATSGAGQ